MSKNIDALLTEMKPSMASPHPKDFELSVEKHLKTNSVDLYLSAYNPHTGKVRVIDTIFEQREVDEGAFDPDMHPTFRLSFVQAQELMSQLWGMNYRPTEYVDSKGEVKRMEEHIKREVAFSAYLGEQNQKLIDTIGQTLTAVLGNTK